MPGANNPPNPLAPGMGKNRAKEREATLVPCSFAFWRLLTSAQMARDPTWDGTGNPAT